MPPASWYTDSDFLKLEHSEIFKKTWQPVLRRDELPEANTWKSGVTAKIPWVITRGPDNQLRAFYNVCRHKGREVVCGSGCSKNGELVCGYHAWTFNLEGKLKSAPQIGGIKNFDKEKNSLLPLAICEWGHWIFINGDLNAKPIAEELSVLTEQLESRHWRNLQYHSHKFWTIDCNWKVYIDNYLDGGYHIPYMHPTLDAQLSMNSYQTECFDTYSVQSSKSTDQKDIGVNYDPTQRIGEGSIYAWIYPNFMINLYGNCLDINYVLPVGESQCKVYYEFYFLELEGEEQKKFIEESIKQSDVTQVEDIEICESVQLGLESGAYVAGRYAPQLEKGEYHFHQLLSKNLLH